MMYAVGPVQSLCEHEWHNGWYAVDIVGIKMSKLVAA